MLSLPQVSEFLKRQQIRAAPLHGKLPQSQRVAELAEFRAGRTQLLVTTDLAGRGIDIANLNYVVNYDFPGNLEQYVTLPSPIVPLLFRYCSAIVPLAGLCLLGPRRYASPRRIL